MRWYQILSGDNFGNLCTIKSSIHTSPLYFLKHNHVFMMIWIQDYDSNPCIGSLDSHWTESWLHTSMCISTYIEQEKKGRVISLESTEKSRVKKKLWHAAFVCRFLFVLFFLSASFQLCAYIVCLLPTVYLYQDSKLFASFIVWYICFPPGFAGTKLKCTVHVALPKRPINQF